jgi:hypothetical protein
MMLDVAGGLLIAGIISGCFWGGYRFIVEDGMNFWGGLLMLAAAIATGWILLVHTGLLGNVSV